MNYRHAFQAGNFADVMKHLIVTRILLYLRGKETPFRVIDTHAGAGLYDLQDERAQRTGEWRDGIGRFWHAALAAPVAALAQPYRDAVAALNEGGTPRLYPGSPLLARSLLRPQDRLVACELEPQAAAALRRALGRDPRARAVTIDGWTALNAYIPPKERRGLVLIDPPFEAADEFASLAERLMSAYRKWPTGLYAVWYPIKDEREVAAFARRLASGGMANVLRAELRLSEVPAAGRLAGSGMVIVNPPWTLQDELSTLMPPLAKILSGSAAGAKVDALICKN